jgi:ABC-type phosphate/phosphonate transport system substrate-binding protein
MFSATTRCAAFAVFLGGLIGVTTAPSSGEERSGALRIGVINSTFLKVTPELLPGLMQPFHSVIRQHTGLEGEFVLGGDANSLGKQLVEGKVHLGVFHGFELAWARLKYPSLKPLVVAVKKHPHFRAYLVVRKDCTAGDLGDLKGQVLTIASNSQPHCNLFLERSCQAEGASPARFFSRIDHPPCSEECLDDVVSGHARAALVDQAGLDSYARDNRGCFERLKTLVKSEPFPSGAIVYCPEKLSKEMAEQFREGMLQANDSQEGKRNLSLCGITALKAVTAEYEEALATIAKAYPPPSGSTR